jgi:hypothetical protein
MVRQARFATSTPSTVSSSPTVLVGLLQENASKLMREHTRTASTIGLHLAHPAVVVLLT